MMMKIDISSWLSQHKHLKCSNQKQKMNAID